MILITGASGFIGSALVRECEAQGLEYCVSSRKQGHGVYINLEDSSFELPDGIDVIIHCAGLAHSNCDDDTLHKINTLAPLTLYKGASQKNISRFIFLSTAHVHGSGVNGKAYSETSKSNPPSPYSLSKYEAELALIEASQIAATKLTIVRPALVYGVGAKGNIAKLQQLAQKCPITPLGLVNNKRSLISVDNLAYFLLLCAKNEESAGETFVIAEQKTISTRDLYSALAQKKVFHLPIPSSIMRFALRKLGKSTAAQQLLGDLVIDSTKARTVLGWQEKKNIFTYYGSFEKRDFFFWQRAFDIFFSFCGIIVLSPLFLLVCILGYFDTKKPLFIQERLGKNKRPFKLVKFRTMRPDTESVATHLVNASAVTKLGNFLRKTKLDELPQLINVLMGTMSLVGPRPGLANQEELTKAREAKNVFDVRPGITGLAQVNCIDMSTPEILAKTDAEMIENYTIKNYFIYIFQTVFGKGSGDRVKR